MRQWLASNTGLKVAALVLATALWFYVNSITSERRVIENVQVEPRLAPGMAVKKMSEPGVNVILRGTHADLWQLTRSELVAIVDLHSQTTPGRVRAPLLPDLVRHPHRVQVVQINPSEISVWLINAPATNAP
jgi:hypothetical protein